LEKERRLRKELEKTYKTLLSEMQRKERSYSADLGEREEEAVGRRRQLSKRTLNYEKSKEGLMSY
jgi:DNA-binding protein H-NS